jgi:hypothetical protein
VVNSKQIQKWFVMLVMSSLPGIALAGIFPPAAGESGSTAIPANDPEIDGWVTGYVDYLPGTEVDAEFQTPDKALGVPGNSDGSNAGYIFDIVSLGRGGSITLTFNTPITNGDGYDFAVFENSFTNDFLEVAKVEVSSDGSTFVAFPAFSLVPASIGAFGGLDPTDLEQLAGKYRGGYGTPFDLQQLAGQPGVDLNNIRYIRLIDVVGDGSAINDLDAQSLADWFGVPLIDLPPSLVTLANSAPPAIYDPYPTIGSAGFDLDAIAILHSAPILVDVDISYWDIDNEIDPASTGNIPVTVFSTSIEDGELTNFDATSIDPATVRFGVGEAELINTHYVADMDSDGDADMSFMFSIQETGIACEDIDAPIMGQTVSGEVFEGVDFVTTVECETSGCHP